MKKGRKCCADGCAKVARGRTDYCASHGGGNRCKDPSCTRAANGKWEFCRLHMNNLENSAQCETTSLGKRQYEFT